MYPSVKYELSELERLVTLGNEGNESTEMIDSFDILEKEVKRIKNTFIQEVFTFADERHLERYIQYHQQATIRLMDRCGTIKSGEPLSLNESVFNGLNRILIFIERHFAKYFDLDAKAPESYILLSRIDVTNNIAIIQKKLTDLEGDPVLIDSIIHTMSVFLSGNSYRDSTYRKVIYIKELQKEVLRVINAFREDQSIDEELRNALNYLNYNTIKFFNYYTLFIRHKLKAAETHSERIEALSYELKRINQEQVKPSIIYTLEAPSLKIQLNNYLLEEIAYEERLKQLVMPVGGKLDESMAAFKLKFEISVSQLAYLIRVFIDMELFKNKNNAEVLRFFSKFMLTRKSEYLSYESLRTKFYNAEQNTKDAVRDLLLRMANHIARN